MQTPRLPKYLMLSSFALLTATTSLIFNNHEIKADTAENTATAAVSTTVSSQRAKHQFFSRRLD